MPFTDKFDVAHSLSPFLENKSPESRSCHLSVVLTAELPAATTEPGTSSGHKAEWIQLIVWQTLSSGRKLEKDGLGAHEGSGTDWSRSGR